MIEKQLKRFGSTHVRKAVLPEAFPAKRLERLSLARVLAIALEVVLLDEPCAFPESPRENNRQ